MFSMRERPAAVKGSRPTGQLPAPQREPYWQLLLAAQSMDTQPEIEGLHPPPGRSTPASSPSPLSPTTVQRHDSNEAATGTQQKSERRRARTILDRTPLTATLLTPARSHLPGPSGCLRQWSRPPSPGGGRTTVTEWLLPAVPGPAGVQAWRRLGRTRALFHVKRRKHSLSFRRVGRGGR